jgi:hypothetical protein
MALGVHRPGGGDSLKIALRKISAMNELPRPRLSQRVAFCI